MTRFRAVLQPVPHGGLYVVVPAEVAAAAGLKHGDRVHGTVNRVPYRSALMKYSGVFHLGVHKATVLGAAANPGDTVAVTIARDDQPLPTDTVPGDLAQALAAEPAAHERWQRLAPARRRQYVGQVLAAKQAPTRLARIERIVATLRAGIPPRRTWSPAKP